MYGTQFPTDQPALQRVQYDPNNPALIAQLQPFVSQIQMAPWLQQYGTYLTGIMMDLITRNVTGPVSMHFYNRMVQNNWMNQDFAREVANAADFIYIRCPQPNPQAIPQLLEAYLDLRLAFETNIAPGLMNFVDPVDRPMFQQKINIFTTELQQIENLRRSLQGMQMAPPMGQPMGVMPPAGRMQGYTSMAMSAPPVPAGFAGYTAPVGAMGRGPGGGRDYSTAGNPPPAAPQAAPVYQAPAPAAATAPTPQQTKGATPMAGEDMIIDPNSIKWNPSAEYFYPMAYNPVFSTMMYKVVKGHTLPFLVKNPDIKNMIDFDRHNIASLFGKPPTNMPVMKDNTELVRDISIGVNDVKEEEQNRDEEGKQFEHTLSLPIVIARTSLESAIQDVRTEALAIIDKDNPPMVFQGYAQIYTPIIGDKSEYELVTRLADSSSYIELREKLKDIGDKASPELVSEISLRMTNLINFILQKNLAIDPRDLLVDDFVLDLDRLLTILKDEYNEKMLNAFLKDQSKRIKANLLIPDMSDENGRKIHELLKSSLISDSWEGRTDLPQYTFIGYTIKLSLLNAVSHDLQIAGMPKLGNLLVEQQSPALYSLARAVFTADNDGQLVAHQFVVANKDGRMLELTEANLMPEGFLVSLVK